MLKIVKTVLRDRRFHRLAGVSALLGAGLVLLAWKFGYDLETFKADWAAIVSFLSANPWWLFAALVILPGFPIPASALMFLAGTVWGENPVMACGLALLALTLNLSWTYWAAARPARGIVEKLIAEGRFQIPELPKHNHLKLILILRLTPGLPLFFQSYLLGFFRVPFRLYLITSLACSGMIACGVVLTGAGVGEGKLTPVIVGVGLLVVGGVLVHWVRQRLFSR